MSTPEIGDLLPPSHVRPVAQGTASSIAISVAMVVAMILASFGISYWSYLSHRAEALRLANDLISSLDQRIQAQVQGYLGPVGRLASLSAEVLGTRALPTWREAATEKFALGVLAGHEQVAISTFADPDGNFLMYARQASGAVDTKRIERRDDRVRTSWVRRDPAGQVITSEVVDNDGYDPRARPWYQGAARTGDVYWSDVYAFFTSKQPGVTVSIPVSDEGGQLGAVYGLDITLASLSEFLSGLDIGDGGQALIFNENGRLVAYPDMERMLLREGDSVRTATIEEMGDAVLSRAYGHFRVEGPGHRILEVNGQRYLNSVISLAPIMGRNWSVMILVPESDFTGVVSSNFRTQLLVSLLVVAVAAALGSKVVKQGLQARRHARAVALGEARLARRSEALGRVAGSAARLDAGDAQALREFTETLTEALDVNRISVWRWRPGAEDLICEDAYDARSGGHTDSTRVKFASLPGLAEHLDVPLAIPDLATDPRSRGADWAYFQQLDVGSLLSAPVTDEGSPAALIWVEDRARSEEWVRDVLPFVEGVARLLARRFAGMGEDPVSSRRASPAPPAVRVTRSARHMQALHSADLDRSRTHAFRQRAGTGAHTDVYERIAVLVMVLDDASLWGSASERDPSRSLLDELVRELQSRVAELGIDYVKILGSSLVCAAGFDDQRDDGDAGANAIGALAVALEECCSEMLTASGHGLSFRIGLDVGPALGAGVGAQDWVYNLWGDAVMGARAMADSCGMGTAQASEACYRILREDYLFALRGHFYVPEMGETATYLLLGHT